MQKKNCYKKKKHLDDFSLSIKDITAVVKQCVLHFKIDSYIEFFFKYQFL